MMPGCVQVACFGEEDDIPPMVGSLFSWKALFTNRRTREDYQLPMSVNVLAFEFRGNPHSPVPPIPSDSLGMLCHVEREILRRTFPTAASPNRTNLTLLLSFGAAFCESAIILVVPATWCLIP